MDDENDEAVAKYSYLLQPIKDLQELFTTDIAQMLDDYQKKITSIVENERYQQENAHRFNFSEAAMLIQGSVSVFGKKVDAVYNQAMHFFETLKSSKSKQKDKGAQADDDEGIVVDDDDGGGVDPCVLQDFSKLILGKVSSLTMKIHELAIPSISVMPMSLMPLADYEKCDVPMYSRNNAKEVIGKKDDYKLNIGYMDESGALLLDLLNQRLLTTFATDEFMNIGMSNEKDQIDNGGDSGCDSPAQANDSGTDLPPIPMEVDIDNMVLEANRRATEGPTMEMEKRCSTVLLKADCPPPLPDQMSFSDCEGGGFDVDMEDAPPPANPWDIQPGVDIMIAPDLEKNPFDADSWQKKPITVKNCHVNLDALVTKNRKIEESLTKGQRTMEMINYLNEYVFMKSKRKRPGNNIANDDRWDSMALFPYIHKMRQARNKRKLAARKEALRKGGDQSYAERIVPVIDDDDGHGDVFDDDDDPIPPANANAIRDVMDDPEISMVFDNNVLLPSQPTNNWNDDPNSQPMPDFDFRAPSAMNAIDTFVAMYDKYWKSAVALSSRLAVRVHEWETRMEPLLEEEFQRKEFDIHEYGSHLLTMFNEKSSVKELPELLTGKKDFEISRYFLSCLMMANTYNLEILNQPNGEDSTQLTTMRLKLLKKDRHHEVFDQEGAL